MNPTWFESFTEQGTQEQPKSACQDGNLTGSQHAETKAQNSKGSHCLISMTLQTST